jgi:hypothetical protein
MNCAIRRFPPITTPIRCAWAHIWASANPATCSRRVASPQVMPPKARPADANVPRATTAEIWRRAEGGLPRSPPSTAGLRSRPLKFVPRSASIRRSLFSSCATQEFRRALWARAAKCDSGFELILRCGFPNPSHRAIAHDLGESPANKSRISRPSQGRSMLPPVTAAPPIRCAFGMQRTVAAGLIREG